MHGSRNINSSSTTLSERDSTLSGTEMRKLLAEGKFRKIEAAEELWMFGERTFGHVFIYEPSNGNLDTYWIIYDSFYNEFREFAET